MGGKICSRLGKGVVTSGMYPRLASHSSLWAKTYSPLVRNLNWKRCCTMGR